LEKERFWLVESSGATNRTGKVSPGDTAEGREGWNEGGTERKEEKGGREPC